MGLRKSKGATRKPQKPAPVVIPTTVAPGVMKPGFPTALPLGMAGPTGMFPPTGVIPQAGMIPQIPVTRAPSGAQLPITTIQPLPPGVVPQMPITTIPQMQAGLGPQIPVTTTGLGGIPLQLPVTTVASPAIGLIPQQQIQVGATKPVVIPSTIPQQAVVTQPTIVQQPSIIQQPTGQAIVMHPQAAGSFVPLGSTISQLPMQCRPIGGRPGDFRFGSGLDSYFALPGGPADRPLCPNELSETDFNRLALLSGLDLPTINQLYLEFQQLTHGRGRLDREQYRNIFLRSFYTLAMQNLERLAEQTFRGFDRDSNGVLDFFDFIAAYKSSSPRIGAAQSQMFNVGLPTSL